MTNDKTQFPWSEMPLSQERRNELLVRVGRLNSAEFTAEDMAKFIEAFTLRTGIDDEWLLLLAYRNGCLR